MLNLPQELADYVTATCRGDLALMLSSGFDVTDEVRNSLLVSIETLEVKLGRPGEATTKVRKSTGARAFIHQYTTETPGHKYQLGSGKPAAYVVIHFKISHPKNVTGSA